MSLSLCEYRKKLVSKILAADSPERARRFIDAAMKALRQNNVNENIVARFVDRMTSELDQLICINTDLRQKSNIEMAKNHLFIIKQKMIAMAG